MGFFSLSIGFTSAIGEIRVLAGRVEHYKTSYGSEVWNYEVPKITVIKPKSFDIMFDGQGSNVTNIANEWAYSVTINASYFGWYNDGTYFPAGVWYDNWFLVNAQTIPQKDINLQVLAYYHSGKIQFMDNDKVDLSTLTQDTPGQYFNAGPWLVKQGKINPDIVKSKSHWQSKTYRTAILRKANGKIYFMVATEKIDLPQFIVFAYNSKLVRKWEKFDLVNLDGWSSTSIRSSSYKFNATKKLPLFIWVK